MGFTTNEARKLLDRLLCSGSQTELLSNDWGDLRTKNLDGTHHFLVSYGRHAHLEGDARNSAQSFVHIDNFFGDGFGIADHQGPGGSAGGVELRARGWGPAPLLADFGEGVGVAGEEIVSGLLGGVPQETD